MLLMLNLGWSLQEISNHYDLSAKVVELIITSHIKAERIRASLLASAQS